MVDLVIIWAQVINGTRQHEVTKFWRITRLLQYLLSFVSIVTEYTTHMGIICAYLSQTPVSNCSQRGSCRFSVAVPHH